MKTILSIDNWVEVPASECLTGLSEAQRKAIVDRILEQVGFAQRPQAERQLLEAAARKLRQHPRVWLSEEERAAFGVSAEDPSRMLLIEENLSAVPHQQAVHLERFYIARYPITDHQYYLFTHGTPALSLPDVLEEPETVTVDSADGKGELPGRSVAAVRSDEAVKLCQQLNARLPSELEWEKAARGSEGRLYPWGNSWNPEAGFFFYGQRYSSRRMDPGRSVTGFPSGASPYGVWAMAGGLPELVTVSAARPVMTRSVDWDGRKILVDIRGCHAKESSEAWAWFDHILALPGRGFWVSLRPVLDAWPKTMWPGHAAGDSSPGA